MGFFPCLFKQNNNIRVGNELFIPYSFIVNNDIFTINS